MVVWSRTQEAAVVAFRFGRGSRVSGAWCVGVALALGASAAAKAQTELPAPPKPDPSRDPALNDPSLEDDATRRRRAPGASSVAPANPPSVPGTKPVKARANIPLAALGADGSSAPGVPKGKFLPEGTFLSGRPGAIVRSPSGTCLFVPAAASGGLAKVVPMVLLPNQRLAQVVADFEKDQTALAANVSGQAFLYQGRQYFLISVFAVSRESEAAGSTSRASSAASAVVDDDVKAMMAELDARPSAPRAMDQRLVTPTPTSSGGGEAKTSKDNVIAEGVVVTGRRARLIRGGLGAGGLTAAFDNGPSNPNLPAMPMLPCRLLEQLESLAASRGENLTIRLSGRTTVFEGRNYLLPTMYQVIRPGDITPLQ
jgi:hypothetical protein